MNIFRRSAFLASLVLTPVCSPAGDFTLAQERWVSAQLKTLTQDADELKRYNQRTRSLVLPELKNTVARQRVDQAARELGIDTARLVLVKDSETVGLTEFSGAFVYVPEFIAMGSRDALLFLLAHEWGHLRLAHGPTALKLLFVSAASDCYACVRQKNPVLAATGYAAQQPEVLYSVLRKHEEAADAYAVRYLAARGLFPDYGVALKEAHPWGCTDEASNRHPACLSRVRAAYRIIGTEYLAQLDASTLARAVMNGALDPATP